MINHELLEQSLGDHYVKYAWAGGEKALQVGRWPHIQLMLEAAPAGVMAEVMARLARLRREQKNAK